MGFNFRMKRAVAMSIVVLLVVVINILYIDGENQHEGIIRFHVIANSDSPEDQALKLKVRDGVLLKMEKEIARLALASKEKDTANVIRDYVIKNQDKIEIWAQEIIKEEGEKYRVNSSLGVTYIPEKQYGKTVFPAGNYEALNIAIGNAKGHNWWCVLFPPLCLIDSSSGEYCQELGVTEKDKIVLKSKVKEMIEEQEKRY